MIAALATGAAAATAMSVLRIAFLQKRNSDASSDCRKLSSAGSERRSNIQVRTRALVSRIAYAATMLNRRQLLSTSATGLLMAADPEPRVRQASTSL